MSDTSDQAGEDLVPEVDAAVAESPAADTPEVQLDDDGNPIEDQAALLDDDHEEIERAGVKYKVPKALVPELLMQADYTKKTQALAESKQALDARETEIAQQAERSMANIREHAQVVHLEGQVEAYTKVDWAALRAQDPDAYREHWDTYQQLKDNLGTAKEAVSKKDRERDLEQQRKHAKQYQEAVTVLQRDIPDWSPVVAQKLTDFAETKGISREQAQQIIDPNLIKILHLAMIGDESEKAKAKAAKLAQAQKVTPAANPAAGARPAPPTGLDDRLTTAEWMRRRNAQLAKKRG